MRKQKRQTVKKLMQCAAIIAAGVLAIILFMLAIWYRGKNSEPVTDEQVAAQMQQAEPLVIETPEAATEGSIRVYDYDGCCIYSYYGKIRINSDGKDGKEIGEYATKERCLEVLDEIQKRCLTYLFTEGGAALMIGDMNVQPFAAVVPRLYEMPEK